jgi:hypothetical protein
MNTVEQVEEALEKLRRTGAECAAKAANFTPAVNVDKADKIALEDPNPEPKGRLP